jgi:hypothetical protein
MGGGHAALNWQRGTDGVTAGVVGAKAQCGVEFFGSDGV